MENMLLGGGGGYYPWSGPGSKKLEKGTLALGYFGIVAENEFIDRDTLRSLGPAAMTAYNIGVMTWHKFAYNGRIIYIPRSAIAQAAKWIDLYNAGMIYGVRGNGTPPLPVGNTGVDQLATTVVFTREGGIERYWPINIRAIRGNEKDPAEAIVDIAKSEYDILYKGLRDGTWEKYSSDPVVGITVAERLAANAGLFWPRNPTGYVTQVSITDTSSRWQPALELVTDPNVALSPYQVQLLPNVGGTVTLKTVADEYDTVIGVKSVVGKVPGFVPSLSTESLVPSVTWKVSVGVGLPLTIANEGVVTSIKPSLLDISVSNLEGYRVRTGHPSLKWTAEVEAIHDVITIENADTVTRPIAPLGRLSARSDLLLTITLEN